MLYFGLKYFAFALGKRVSYVENDDDDSFFNESSDSDEEPRQRAKGKGKGKQLHKKRSLATSAASKKARAVEKKLKAAQVCCDFFFNHFIYDCILHLYLLFYLYIYYSRSTP